MINKLKGYRTMAGYTQEEISKHLGISKSLYVYCENGIRTFTQERKNIVYQLLKKKIPDLKIEDVFPMFEE